MMWLLSLVTGLGVPLRWAKPVLAVVGALLLLGVLWGGKCAYDKSVIRRHEAKVQLEQAKRERQADANLQAAKENDQAAAQQRKEEIDNATRNIPDQTPSARQRARVCVELRRQAKAHGRPQPAC